MSAQRRRRSTRTTYTRDTLLRARRPPQPEGVLVHAQIRERMYDLVLELGRLQQHLDESEGHVRTVLSFVESALSLLEEIHQLHGRLEVNGRRAPNQAMFEMVLIADETEAEPRLTEPFRLLRAAACDVRDRRLRGSCAGETRGERRP